MTGSTFAAGPCFLCTRIFTFDPELVPSAVIDPVTKRPPDVDEAGAVVWPTAESLVRARRVPLCRDCVDDVNEARLRAGREPIEILPGAYGRSETY